jgi:hypothetical protein
VARCRIPGLTVHHPVRRRGRLGGAGDGVGARLGRKVLKPRGGGRGHDPSAAGQSLRGVRVGACDHHETSGELPWLSPTRPAGFGLGMAVDAAPRKREKSTRPFASYPGGDTVRPGRPPYRWLGALHTLCMRNQVIAAEAPTGLCMPNQVIGPYLPVGVLPGSKGSRSSCHARILPPGGEGWASVS